MNRSSFRVAAIGLFAALAIGSQALALPSITGNVAFSGGATLDSATLTSATQVLNWGPVTVVGVTPGSILDLGINAGDPVTLSSPWSFNSGPVANMWITGTTPAFTFNLTSSFIDHNDATGLLVAGSGILLATGYAPTPAVWNFSTQNPSISGALFSVSSSAGSVPDGGTTALLLGLGLTAIALVARQRKLV